MVTTLYIHFDTCKTNHTMYIFPCAQALIDGAKYALANNMPDYEKAGICIWCTIAYTLALPVDLVSLPFAAVADVVRLTRQANRKRKARRVAQQTLPRSVIPEGSTQGTAISGPSSLRD